MAKDYMDDMYFNDVPDYCGYLPDCPECGSEMRYNNILNLFKCFSCGYTMDEADWEPDDEDPDEIPWGCQSCGGPWPECKASCSIYDE